MAKYIYKDVGVDGVMVPFTCSPVSLIEGTNSNMMASIHCISIYNMPTMEDVSDLSAWEGGEELISSSVVLNFTDLHKLL